MLRRSLAFNFIEEGKVGTSYVLHLLRKRTHSLELTRARDEVVLGFRHRLRHAQELSLGPVPRTCWVLGNLSCDLLERVSVPTWSWRNWSLCTPRAPISCSVIDVPFRTQIRKFMRWMADI